MIVKIFSHPLLDHIGQFSRMQSSSGTLTASLIHHVLHHGAGRGFDPAEEIKKHNSVPLFQRKCKLDVHHEYHHACPHKAA